MRQSRGAAVDEDYVPLADYRSARSSSADTVEDGQGLRNDYPPSKLRSIHDAK